MKELIPMNDYGSVYVIKTKCGCKIGASKNPKNRIKSLQTISPLKFERIYIGENCSNYFENEHLLHEKFKSKRSNGEWFNEKFETIVQNESELVHLKDANPNHKFVAEDIIDKIIGAPEEIVRERFEKQNSILINAVNDLGFKIVYFKCVPYVQTPCGEISIELFESIYVANTMNSVNGI